MRLCSFCKKEITIDKYFTQRSRCPHCGGDLHICLNCRFYSEKSHNKCLEPRAEFQRTRDKANFCDWFEFKDAPHKESTSKEDIKKAFDSLFKK